MIILLFKLSIIDIIYKKSNILWYKIFLEVIDNMKTNWDLTHFYISQEDWDKEFKLLSNKI